MIVTAASLAREEEIIRALRRLLTYLESDDVDAVDLGTILRRLDLEELLSEPILEAAMQLRGVAFKSIGSFCTWPGTNRAVVTELVRCLHEKAARSHRDFCPVRPIVPLDRTTRSGSGVSWKWVVFIFVIAIAIRLMR